MTNKLGFAGLGLFVLTFVVMSLPVFADAATLDRELQFGMNGSDVSSVQTFLRQDQALYPQGLVTGYFGSLTKAAVINFQLRNEIPAVGRIGPMTLPIINLQIATGMYPGMGAYAANTGIYTGADTIAPTINGLSVFNSKNTANVSWNTSESATGVVYYSSSPLVLSERMTSVGVSGNTAVTDNSLRTSQSVAMSGLQPNTTYYYLIYTTDQSGNVTVSWPSTFRTIN